jgi:hypothetical protein
LYTRKNVDTISRSLEVTADGGYAIAGYTDPWGTSSDALLLKTDAEGNIDFLRLFNVQEENYAHSLGLTSDNGYILAGYIWSGSEGWYDVYVVKAKAEGQFEWSGTYGGNRDEHAQSVIQTSDNGFVLAGDTRSYGLGAADVYLVKLAGGGSFPDVTVETIPDTIPVRVPRGGSFGFTGILANNSDESVTVDVWTMAAGPLRDVYGPFKILQNIRLAPNDTLSGHFNQGVHPKAPLGSFNYITYCGKYSEAAYDSFLFVVEIIEESPGVEIGGGWTLEGSF